MNHYLLVVEVLEDEMPRSHAVYFKSKDGEAASDYADLWLHTQYEEQDELFELRTFEVFLIRTVGEA